MLFREREQNDTDCDCRSARQLSAGTPFLEDEYSQRRADDDAHLARSHDITYLAHCHGQQY